MRRLLLVRVAVVVATLLQFGAEFAHGCLISGQESGYCDFEMNPIGINGKRIKNSPYKLVNMPFCGRYINYVPCVPKYQKLEPDRNYPIGRWYNFTILQKDEWVRNMVRGNINWRIDLEVNQSLKDTETNEWGNPGEVVPRFFKQPDCKQAYVKYMCWINFPKCDNDLESVRTCESSCINFFKTCGYDKNLWRCGPSKWFNGYYPERARYVQDPNSDATCDTGRADDGFGGKAPVDRKTGNAPGCLATYYRDFFPGQPFKNGKPCTGAASLSSKPHAPFIVSCCLMLGLFSSSHRWWWN